MEEEFKRVFGESAEEAVRKEREEGAGEEAVRARARPVEKVPSEKEVEERNLDHGIFQSWCPHCKRGRGKEYGRVRKVIGGSDAPIVGVGYMYMLSEQEKEEDVGMPVVVVQASKTTMIMAKVVPSKGVEKNAVEVAKRAVECLCHRRVFVSSESEIAILSLKEVVRRETDVVPAGDHQANGLVENAAKNAQSQFRLIKDALESRSKTRTDGDYPAASWLVMHEASVVDRGRKGEEGFIRHA
jgi:hypothetical protein